jgi:hypothetical protein
MTFYLLASSGFFFVSPVSPGGIIIDKIRHAGVDYIEHIGDGVNKCVVMAG